MSTNEFVFGVGPAEKIQTALRRNLAVVGKEMKILEWLASGNNISTLGGVVNGCFEIKPREYLVDLDADPFLPEGWKVESHLKGGQFKFDPTKVRLHLDEEQLNGKWINGTKLHLKLKALPIYNANLLDFYLKNPHLIPEEWKGKFIYFWGTIYRDADGCLYVRYLCWRGEGWRWRYDWLECDWRGFVPALCGK